MFVLAMAMGFSFAQDPVKPMPNKKAPHEMGAPNKHEQCREPGHVNPMMLKMKKDFIQENFVIESNKKEAFWNAYNEYEKSILEAHKAQREYRKSHNIPTRMNADSLSNLSDEAILNYYENNFITKNQIFKAEEKFFNQLKNILSAQQIAQYYILEKNFHQSAVKMNRPMPTKMEMKPMKMDMQAAPMDKDKATH